jgi:hypothetical protein
MELLTIGGCRRDTGSGARGQSGVRPRPVRDSGRQPISGAYEGSCHDTRRAVPCQGSACAVLTEGGVFKTNLPRG